MENYVVIKESDLNELGHYALNSDISQARYSLLVNSLNSSFDASELFNAARLLNVELNISNDSLISINSLKSYGKYPTLESFLKTKA